MEQKQYPNRLFLDDGTEVRLVPIEKTGGRPLYMSMEGNGYSLNRNGMIRRVKPGKIGKTRTHPTHSEYLAYTCFNNIYAHHAVLLAWGFPRPEGYQCDHKNGDRFDNRLENLEWVTRAENARRRWELYARKGLGYRGKPITELSKYAQRKRETYRKKGKLIQLTINFNN